MEIVRFERRHMEEARALATDAIRAWFDNGFGHHCADAIRKVEEIGGIVPAEGITYEEIPPQEAFLVRELRRKLSEHMGESSCFMYTKADRFEEWVNSVRVTVTAFLSPERKKR